MLGEGHPPHPPLAHVCSSSFSPEEARRSLPLALHVVRIQFALFAIAVKNTRAGSFESIFKVRESPISTGSFCHGIAIALVPLSLSTSRRQSNIERYEKRWLEGGRGRPLPPESLQGPSRGPEATSEGGPPDRERPGGKGLHHHQRRTGTKQQRGEGGGSMEKKGGHGKQSGKDSLPAAVAGWKGGGEERTNVNYFSSSLRRVRTKKVWAIYE